MNFPQRTLIKDSACGFTGIFPGAPHQKRRDKANSPPNSWPITRSQTRVLTQQGLPSPPLTTWKTPQAWNLYVQNGCHVWRLQGPFCFQEAMVRTALSQSGSRLEQGVLLLTVPVDPDVTFATEEEGGCNLRKQTVKKKPKT